MARLLIRMSWLATATNTEMLPRRSPSRVASASRYASARAPSGTASTSSRRASEREQEPQRTLPLWQANLGCVLGASARAEGHGRRGGLDCRFGHSRVHRSACLVGSVQERGSGGVREWYVAPDERRGARPTARRQG